MSEVFYKDKTVDDARRAILGRSECPRGIRLGPERNDSMGTPAIPEPRPDDLSALLRRSDVSGPPPGTQEEFVGRVTADTRSAIERGGDLKPVRVPSVPEPAVGLGAKIARLGHLSSWRQAEIKGRLRDGGIPPKEEWEWSDGVMPKAPAPRDLSLIWTDCQACAYKHLTAAYAALTSLDLKGGGVFESPEPWEVYTARADIAMEESRSKYTGNLALAVGCLALAEQHMDAGDEARHCIRSMRLRLINGEADTVVPMFPAPGALVMAHITEAAREAPEYQSAIRETVRDPLRLGDADIACTGLIRLIRRLETEYHLGTCTPQEEKKHDA